jgi:hypothetical protein
MRRPLVVRLNIFFKRKCVKMKDLTELTSKCFTDFFGQYNRDLWRKNEKQYILWK